jgi:hypothetical protein
MERENLRSLEIRPSETNVHPRQGEMDIMLSILLPAALAV